MLAPQPQSLAAAPPPTTKLLREANLAQPSSTSESQGKPDEYWVSLLRPAITWLYHFVDTQMTMAEGAAATAILAEHKKALHELCRQVNGVLKQAGSDRGLAACLWRALVALFTHFTERAEPLLGKLRQHELDAAAQAMLSARQLAEKAELEAQLLDLRRRAESGEFGGGDANSFNRRRYSTMGRRGSTRRKSSARPGQLSPNTLATLQQQQGGSGGRHVGFDLQGGGGSKGSSPPPPRATSTRRSSSARFMPSVVAVYAAADVDEEEEDEEGEEEEDEEDADELAELHERLVDVTNELVQERRKTQSLQSTCDQQREKLIAAQNLKKMQLFTRFGKFNANARRYNDDDSDEDDDDDEEGSDARSDDSGVPTGPSAEAGIYAKRAAKAAREAKRAAEKQQLDTLREEVSRLKERCEAEASRRQFLEGLREDFVKRFSAAFVEQIERGLPPQGSAVAERLQLASGYAPGSAPGYAPAPAVPPTPPPTHPMVKRMVGFDASLGL